MDFLDKQIPPPRDWAKFEDLTRSLCAAIYGNPLASKNGRQGQAQHGVDVFIEHPPQSGEWVGVQCKGKDGNFGAKATISEFDEELAKAEKFEPPLKHWIFATTAQNDQKLQAHARKVSQQRATLGAFSVDVLGWDSLLALIAQHEDVIREFYPEQISQLRDDLERIEQDSTIALEGLDDVLRHSGICLTLLRRHAWRATSEAVSSNKTVRLIGEGGTGKSGLVKRLVQQFDGPSFVVRDSRVSAQSLTAHLSQLGVSSSIADILEKMTAKGPALLVVDGADRLLSSDRRELVTDLFRAVAQNPAREKLRIITSARAYQDRELVADALAECGFEDTGARIEVGALDDHDCAELSQAFPHFAPLLKRDDLAGQNRSLFLVRELLKRDAPPTGTWSELDVAEAWATGAWVAPGVVVRRSRALSEIGEAILTAPQKPIARSALDPDGLENLLDEGVVTAIPGTDAVRLTHDVHEDWLIARQLAARNGEVGAALKAAEEPLWWQKAIALHARRMLEVGDKSGWLGLLTELDAANDLDPSWSRAVLSSPLRSENSQALLDALEHDLLDDEGKLLRRIFDTLLVFETALDENVLRYLSDRDEATRYRIAAYWRKPKLAAWAPFLRWSLPRWDAWPRALIPRLSELASLFARATAKIPNGLSQSIAPITLKWLVEIENAHDLTDWKDRREPFDLSLQDYDGWEKVGDRLRETLVNCVESAPTTAENYLRRVATEPPLREARRKLIEDPGQIPSRYPAHWVDICLAQFTPRRPRAYRESVIGPQLFTSLDHNSAGLRGEREMSPSSPLRAGLDQLFRTNETEALRLFHALERRASVSWRWFMKCHEKKRPIPLDLGLGHRTVRLWGYDPVYRWSRGILGPHALGSAYLALDDWLEEQAAAGRPVSELIDLVLADQGLVATAAPLIALLPNRVNEEGVIDNAAPFLASPRLWEFDIRRHLDDQGGAHRIGFWNREDIHYEALEANHQRNAKRLPLHHALLLPFRLMANSDSQKALETARQNWTHRDLADFEEELGDPTLIEERSRQIERYRSDADASRIAFEQAEEGIRVSITPPEEDLPTIEAHSQAATINGRAMALTNWVRKTREDGEVAPEFSIQEAILSARELANDLESENQHLGLARQIGGAAIVGTAAVAARYLDDQALANNRNWIVGWLLDAGEAGDREDLFEEALLFDDFLELAAWGVGALISRQPHDAEIDAMAAKLAVHRVYAISAAILTSLDWSTRPDFVRRLHIAALDTCVFHVGWWWRSDKERENARRRNRTNRERLAKDLWKIDLKRHPDLPPRPHGRRLVWTGKWPVPAEILEMPARRMLDWSRAAVLFKATDWSSLVRDASDKECFSHYFQSLVDWTRLYSEDTDRYDRQFPYEWGHELARTLGRFAFSQGGEDWLALTKFEYHDRSADLVGDYLDALTTAMVVSGSPPTDSFWSAWRPAAHWLLENALPRRRGAHDHLPHSLTAAGMLGPYMTPLPPDWPYLEHVLEDVGIWVRETAHLPAAASATLAIVERMNREQRRDYFVTWMKIWVDKHGSDETFWSYSGLADKAAAYLKPLEAEAQEVRADVRRILGILADAGGSAARELIAAFSVRRV
ncbi:hypothetical protein AAG596_15260 [Citromicrobium bathyomarinum]|uniref:hypothetical protein n=1 Tax=Citromicrobium bathyomarinum TaxID=72174 RepID=UPI00315AE3B2